MASKMKVFCSVMLFLVVFGLRFFCSNCQRYSLQQQQQQLQMQKFQQHIPLHQQLQAVSIPMQKDLLVNENRLHSQVQLCGSGRLVFPCPTRIRKPFVYSFPVPVSSTVQAIVNNSPTVIRSENPFAFKDSPPDNSAQKDYYSDWSHVDNTKEQLQEVPQQHRHPGKNCKRKRRPQPQVLISTTQSSPVISQEQYWRGHVEDEQPRVRPRPHPSEAIPTQISERTREPSTTKFTERIDEPTLNKASEAIQEFLPTQISEKNRDKISLDYSRDMQKSLSNLYSEKIREFNPTKESLIAREPITSTVFDKNQDPAPTRILETNPESYSTKPFNKVLPQVSPSKPSERIREQRPKKGVDRSRESQLARNSERIREPLAALEKEQKLFELRDKQRQELVAEVTSGYHDKSYRRPYSQAKKERNQHVHASKEESENVASASRSPIVLKEILKNSGGLSLSEILQQKNLSLDDLLKGKQNALLALQTTAASPPKPEQINSRERFSKPNRRIPPTSTSTSTTSTTSTTTAEPLITDQSLEESSVHSEASREVLSDEITSEEYDISRESKNATSRKNFKFPSRIRMSATTRRQHLETTLQQRFSTTTTTTAKPITTRIPLYKKRQHSRPPFMRNANFKKPDFTASSESKASKESQEKLESLEDTFTLNYPKRSRFTSSSTTTTTVETFSDQTDPATNFVEDSGENEILLQSPSIENSSLAEGNNSMTTTSESNSIDSKIQDAPTTDHIYRYNSLKNYIDNNLPHAVLMDIDLADIDPVDDRTDLLELIEDRRSGNRLIKVLEQRNMTLEELIEHRKRGSSQLHLATFVQNRSGVFPGKKVVVNDDMDIVTAFENFPHFNLLNLKSVKPDEIKTDSQGSSYFTSIIDIEPTDEVFKESNSSGSAASRKNATRNPSSSTNIQRQPFYPSWKSLALASLASAENARRFLQRPDPEPPQQTAQRHQSTVIEEDPILQIEDEVARAHDLVDLELSGHGFKRSTMNLIHTSQMPPGIRSAIVASAAIVLTSLVTFMLIFVACRWKQRRRRRKLDYMETYNALKSKIPVISSRITDELATSTTSLGIESAPSRVSRSNSRQSHHNQISIVFPGTSSYPSGSSLSTPSSKLNTMDPNFPEVQEYLFDALRKSF